MEKIDLRKLERKELKQVRKQIVRLKKMGKSGKEIEELTGVRSNRISEIWSAYQKSGEASLLPCKRGRKSGAKTLLTKEEEGEIRNTIIDKTPDQLKLSGCLWTRQKISDFIKRKYHKSVSLRCVTNYMKRWGFTCQRPTKRAYSQDDVRVKRFMEDEYPSIAARAKVEGADIFWSDETGINNQENHERGFAPKGHPPVIKFETKHERINMISAITNKGSVRFMIFDESMTQQKLIEFLRRLVTDSTQKVFLILDNLRVHHGKLVRKWLDEHNVEIEVFFLPPYAPEYNPDEYLNHTLKLDVHSNNNPRTKADITHKVQSFMRRLQHNKDKVCAFFRHPKLSYLVPTF